MQQPVCLECLQQDACKSLRQLRTTLPVAHRRWQVAHILRYLWGPPKIQSCNTSWACLAQFHSDFDIRPSIRVCFSSRKRASITSSAIKLGLFSD
eukprot:15465920-Alexandrium_andersonii.AAC.1